MIPIDLVAIIEKGLENDRRPPDGLLHASSDLVGSLRHTQLRYVGAPELPRSVVDDIRLRTGTMWHGYIASLLGDSGAPFMAEVNLTPWMPEGWSGTADWLFWSPEYEAFVLGDLKTTKGESIKYKETKGMSTEHHWQLSAYWHALVEAGFPMLDVVSVLYLPMNNIARESDPEPVVIEAAPLDGAVVQEQMEWRWLRVQEYRDAFNDDDSNWSIRYLNDALAPVMEREQKVTWNYTKGVFELTLVPHWLSDYCPFDNALCDCSEQGTTKMGEFAIDAVSKDMAFIPRRDKRWDFSDAEPEVWPTPAEIRKRIK